MKSIAIGNELTLLEAAAAKRLHPDTIRRACTRGDLPHARVLGRIRIQSDDLESWASGPTIEEPSGTRRAS